MEAGYAPASINDSTSIEYGDTVRPRLSKRRAVHRPIIFHHCLDHYTPTLSLTPTGLMARADTPPSTALDLALDTLDTLNPRHP